ncbi:MAG: helix-turn-helix transcriptional regulator [Evtepia sp.]|uniref:helix-turn-helix domain-containing protein n=1 Tax=Evtepia sp. TaxID=2773933 RepID=UPI002A750DB2|nr:helix-turn-helix transcriptional regulator [Evtepia sp.]MDY3013997.1 helix-turn-helix transcriptional regulator [Evtepia sp.]
MIAKLAQRLKQLRLEKDLRQDQLAKLVHVEKSSISMYENDVRQPSYEVLIRYAEVFNVSVDYLLGRTNDRSLDLSGLTAAEIAIISELVDSMTAKNRIMEELKR